jgi:hypothetical protein
MFQEEKDIFERYIATSPRTDDLKVWGNWFTELAGKSDALLMRRRAAAADAEAGVLDEFGEALSYSSGLDRPPAPRLGLRRGKEGLCLAHIRGRGFASVCASWEPAPCL